MENTGGIIQGDNSTRHCFVIRDLITNSHDYETENLHHRQNFCLILSKSSLVPPLVVNPDAS